MPAPVTARLTEPGSGPSPPFVKPSLVPEPLRQEVVALTQTLVQVNSGPDNLVAGENQVCDRLQAYAQAAGLEVQRCETVNGKPMLVVTLPGSDPNLGHVGFVHHSDVVPPEGQWKLGAPFSGDLVKDEEGREVLVGRGSIDTKGPAAQILVAMKHLKATGQVPARTTRLYVFPDEETGSKDGAWLLSRTHPELFRQVEYWVVEGSGILSPVMLRGLGVDQDVPYLAVAQKYTLPMQMELKSPTTPDQAVHKTLAALERLDDYLDEGKWTHLGDSQESDEAYRRMGNLVGGFKGWLLRNFWDWRLVQRRMGPSLAAANRTDLSKTDFYLSNNPGGGTQGPNVKPSSASVVLQVDLTDLDRDKALRRICDAAGEDFKVEPEGSTHPSTLRVRVSLPQEHYQGGNHGSTADREHDAIDVTDRALARIEKSFRRKGWKNRLQVVDYFTSKSLPPGPTGPDPVTSKVTLDLRVAIDDDRAQVLDELQQRIGPEFQLRSLIGPEEMDAQVRRLSHHSPLFVAAEEALHSVYGADTPVLFGNTTASNDTRFLMEANPASQALTFVPVLYTEHGAHGPDECVTVDSLKQGVDWCAELMARLGSASFPSPRA